LEEFDAVWAQLFLKEIIKEIANKRECGILYTSSWAKKVLGVHGPRKRPGEWLEIFLFLVSVGSTFTLAVRFRAASFFGAFFCWKQN
jgi:hypothetical protein